MRVSPTLFKQWCLKDHLHVGLMDEPGGGCNVKLNILSFDVVFTQMGQALNHMFSRAILQGMLQVD